MKLSCTICYELFIPTEDIQAAPCGHILHHACWKGWLERSANCPDCRKPTHLNQLIKLFFNLGDGEDYTTLNNKYDALRCELSCKTKDCEGAERKLKLQTDQAMTLRQQVQQLKTENENLKKTSGKFPAESGLSSVKIAMAAYKNLLKNKEESDLAIKRNKELTEELKKKTVELENLKRGKTFGSQSKLYTEADVKDLQKCQVIVGTLKNCLDLYDEMKKNSEFVKTLRVYTEQVDPYVDLWDDVEDDPAKYVELFKDVKMYLEQKERREEQLRECPRGCVLELSGFPKSTNLQWQDIRAAVEQFDVCVAFITFNPGDEIAYVRLDEDYPGEKPARKFVKRLSGNRIRVAEAIPTVRALQGQEELKFLRRSLEDRDRRNRERARKRKGYDYDEDQETLFDESMRMVAENPTKIVVPVLPAFVF